MRVAVAVAGFPPKGRRQVVFQKVIIDRYPITFTIHFSTMASKLKTSKRHSFAKQDKEDNRKFLAVLAVATVALMLLMYFIFTR